MSVKTHGAPGRLAEALHQLDQALERYLDACLPPQSDGDGRCEPILPGHALHEAVIQVQECYPKKRLPVALRTRWRQLLRHLRCRCPDADQVIEAAQNFRDRVERILADRRIDPPAWPSGGGLQQLITLDQAAALVNRKKRSLEKYIGKMPPPRVIGRGGKPHEWAYDELRPWLEEKFSRRLPETFRFWRSPADRS
ncbi:MAG: hypothetical protein HY000_31225 [Planctomycetes bacterium]|nr:hypothetical protein [Planctomycetota bacterium]